MVNMAMVPTQEIDFSESQLPPEELEAYRSIYRSERQEEQARIDAKLARVRLRFGSEEHFKGGLGLSGQALPLIVLRD